MNGKCEHKQSQAVELGNAPYAQCLGCGVRLEQLDPQQYDVRTLPRFSFKRHGDALRERLDTLETLKQQVLALYPNEPHHKDDYDNVDF